MEEINQSIIEKYLAHELTPSEEKAVEERNGWVTYLSIEPRWDKFRHEPRFSEIMSRVGLGLFNQESNK